LNVTGNFDGQVDQPHGYHDPKQGPRGSEPSFHGDDVPEPEGMKLWVDDGRAEPPGWTRARNLRQAQAYLSAYEFREASLDHDLGKDGNGLDLVRWMIDRRLVPPRITIHSWNPDGANAMAAALSDAGYGCALRPFNL